MALDDKDLHKIKAVVETEGQQTRTYVDVRLAEFEGRMATKLDVAKIREEMATREQLEEVKTMLTEDLNAFGGDVAKLKRRVAAKASQ